MGKNIKSFNLDNQINVIYKDALDVELNDKYDLIFIDAAKSQYIKFFEKFEKVLSHLKLKASYSLTATPPPTSYTSSTNVFKAYNPYRVFTVDKETGIQLVHLQNDDLTYEKKHERIYRKTKKDETNSNYVYKQSKYK